MELKDYFALSNFGHQAVIQNGLCSEFIASMYDGHGLSNSSEVESFLNRSIAPANHAHILTLIEKTIAGCTARDSATHEGFFTG